MINLFRTAVVCLFLITGCGGNDIKALTPKMPEATFSSLNIDAMSFDRSDMTFDFAVNNPNVFNLELDGLRYDVIINEQSVVAGTSTQKMSLAAGQSSMVSLPVSLVFADIINAVGSLAHEKTFAYEIKSELDIAAPILGVVTIPVSASGDLPIPRLPRIKKPSLTINQVTLAGASMNLAFEVENPNVFNLILNELQYVLKVGGREWATMKAQDEMSLEKDKATRISLPVMVDFASIGRSGFSLLQQDQPFAFEVDGNVNVLPELPGFLETDIPFSLDRR